MISKSLFLDAEPTDGDDVNYKVIVVVFTDLSAGRAQGVFADVLQQLAVPSYAEDGIVVRAVLRGQRGDCDIQLELSPVPITRAVSVREARGGQRLEVLLGRRGLAQPVGGSLWRVGSPGSCGGTTPVAVAGEQGLIWKTSTEGRPESFHQLRSPEMAVALFRRWRADCPLSAKRGGAKCLDV